MNHLTRLLHFHRLSLRSAILCIYFTLLLFYKVPFAQSDELEKNDPLIQAQNDENEEAASAFLKEYADLDKNNNLSSWKFYVDIDSSFEYQNLDMRNAEITTVSLQPYAHKDSWLIGLNLPWKNVDGNALVFRSSPNCVRIRNALESRPSFNITDFPRLDSFFNSQCFDLAESDQGPSDISVFANYRYRKDAGSPYINVNTAIKWDNADSKKRLGTDTRELWNQLLLGWSYRSYNSEISFGHTTFVGGELEDFYKNYFDLSGKLKKTFNRDFSIAASINWLQAPDEFSDDELFISTTIDVHSNMHWHFSLQVEHYIETGSTLNQTYNSAITYSF